MAAFFINIYIYPYLNLSKKYDEDNIFKKSVSCMASTPFHGSVKIWPFIESAQLIEAESLANLTALHGTGAYRQDYGRPFVC
jgi:hypothetical protein